MIFMTRYKQPNNFNICDDLLGVSKSTAKENAIEGRRMYIPAVGIFRMHLFTNMEEPPKTP